MNQNLSFVFCLRNGNPLLIKIKYKRTTAKIATPILPKNKKDNPKNSAKKILAAHQFFREKDENVNEKSNSQNKTNPAFIPIFFSKNGYRPQRPFYFKNVRFDKTLSRTPKIISSNLGGRGFRFNMTLESRIPKFKINTY